MVWLHNYLPMFSIGLNCDTPDISAMFKTNSFLVPIINGRCHLMKQKQYIRCFSASNDPTHEGFHYENHKPEDVFILN